MNTGFQPNSVDGLQPTYVRTQHSAVSAVHSAVSAVHSTVSAYVRTYIDAGNKEAIERLPAKITYVRASSQDGFCVVLVLGSDSFRQLLVHGSD